MEILRNKFHSFYCYYNIMLVQQRSQLIFHIIKNIDEELTENGDSSQQRETKKNNIVLKKINNRVFKNHHLSYPSPYTFFKSPIHHVYKLFNTFGINQIALTTPDFEESFMRTYFYHRVVTKVQKYRNAVVVSIIPHTEPLNQPAYTYIVQKMKSHGNAELYRLATLIEELYGSFAELKNKRMETIVQEDKQSITKYLNQLGNEMYFCKFGLFKMAFSNSLLEYLGYNVEQFCIETIKYRTVLMDFMSSNIYFKLLYHALTTLKYLMAVDLNKITSDDYIRRSYLEFVDYIYSKDYKRSYCDMEFIIPVRGIICFKIKKIHYQESELHWKPYGTSYESQNQEKKSYKEKEYELLNKLQAIPSNWLKKSKPKVAGYKLLQIESNEDKEERLI